MLTIYFDLELVSFLLSSSSKSLINRLIHYSRALRIARFAYKFVHFKSNSMKIHSRKYVCRIELIDWKLHAYRVIF